MKGPRGSTPLRLVPPAARATQIKLNIECLEARRLADLHALAAHMKALNTALSREEWRQYLDARGNTEQQMQEFLKGFAS